MRIIRRFDELAFRMRASLLGWRNMTTSLCIGIIIGAVVNVFTGDDAANWQLIYGRMADRNRPLFYLMLTVMLLLVIVWLGEWGLSYYCKRRRWDLLLAEMARVRTGRTIAPFSASVITWGENLTLQSCPDFHLGWKLDAIELRWVKGGHVFTLSTEEHELYEMFREKHKAKRWYQNDGVKARLVNNPISFTDAPALILEVQKCMYSQVQFTNLHIAADQSRRQECLQSVVKGDIPFANVLVIHVIVVTSDDLLLATLSSTKKDQFGGCWSFSFEEQLSPEDLSGSDVHQRTVTWMKRALSEELGLSETDYSLDNARVLSVFIEGHNLNCGLCCVLRLSIDSTTLSSIIAAQPRPDYEFTEHRFYTVNEAVELLRHPNIPLHPTSEYRLFLALCHLLTPPTLARKLFDQENL